METIEETVRSGVAVSEGNICDPTDNLYKCVFINHNLCVYRRVRNGEIYGGTTYAADGFVLAWTESATTNEIPVFVPIR